MRLRTADERTNTINYTGLWPLIDALLSIHVYVFVSVCFYPVLIYHSTVVIKWEIIELESTDSLPNGFYFAVRHDFTHTLGVHSHRAAYVVITSDCPSNRPRGQTIIV